MVGNFLGFDLKIEAQRILRTEFIISSLKMSELYVEFLKKAKQDEELAYISDHIDDEIKEFEITDEEIMKAMQEVLELVATV